MEQVNAISTAQAKIEELTTIRDRITQIEEQLYGSYIGPIEKFIKRVSELEFEFSSKFRREVSVRNINSRKCQKRT